MERLFWRSRSPSRYSTVLADGGHVGLAKHRGAWGALGASPLRFWGPLLTWGVLGTVFFHRFVQYKNHTGRETCAKFSVSGDLANLRQTFGTQCGGASTHSRPAACPFDCPHEPATAWDVRPVIGSGCPPIGSPPSSVVLVLRPPFPFNSLYPPAPRCGAAWKRPGNGATPTRCPASPTCPYVDLGAGRRPAGGYLSSRASYMTPPRSLLFCCAAAPSPEICPQTACEALNHAH
jgi:hypothetical protein